MPSAKQNETRDSTGDDHSLADRGRGFLRSARGTARSVRETVTGTNIEHLVSEHSELYTQVLLGLHRDLEAKGRTIQEHSSQLHSMEERLASMADMQTASPAAHALQTEALKSAMGAMRTFRYLVLAAISIALVSLGVAIWSLL